MRAVTADDVVFVECELGRDDGRLEYEIEFIRRTGSSYTEYDYEIDANTGAIVSTDRDAEHFHGSQTTASVTADRAQADRAGRGVGRDCVQHPRF